MNIINQFNNINNLFNTPVSKPFVIYEIGALDAKTPAELEQFTAIQFDSFIEYEFDQEVKIPYQPLENGSYSTDSILNNPYFLQGTGAITMMFDNSVVNSYSDIEDVTEALNYYQNSKTQLIIFKSKPVFTTYKPIHLQKVKYRVSSNNITLYAEMVFQEVRSASSSSISLGQPTLSNGTIITNPTNVNIKDTGIVAPDTNVANPS